MNRSNADKVVTIAGTGLPALFDVYQTSPTQNCTKTGTVAPGGSVTLPVKSLTTLYNTPVTRAVDQRSVTETRSLAGVAERALVFDFGGRLVGRAAAGSVAGGVQARVVKQTSGTVARTVMSSGR